MAECWWELSSWPVDCGHLDVCSYDHLDRERNKTVMSLTMTGVPEAPPSWPHVNLFTSQKPHLWIPPHSGVGHHHVNLEGDTHLSPQCYSVALLWQSWLGWDRKSHSLSEKLAKSVSSSVHGGANVSYLEPYSDSHSVYPFSHTPILTLTRPCHTRLRVRERSQENMFMSGITGEVATSRMSVVLTSSGPPFTLSALTGTWADNQFQDVN